MTDSPSTEPDIEDREANIQMTVQSIVDRGHEAIYEDLDRLHKRNIHDNDVMKALHSLGFPDVTDVRVGRHVVVETRAASADDAKRRAAEMCERLLANPVTEDFEIEQVVATGGA